MSLDDVEIGFINRDRTCIAVSGRKGVKFYTIDPKPGTFEVMVGVFVEQLRAALRLGQAVA